MSTSGSYTRLKEDMSARHPKMTHAHGDEQWEPEGSKCGIYEHKGLKLGKDKVHKLRKPKHKPTSVPANQTTLNVTPDEL